MATPGKGNEHLSGEEEEKDDGEEEAASVQKNVDTWWLAQPTAGVMASGHGEGQASCQGVLQSLL